MRAVADASAVSAAAPKGADQPPGVAVEDVECVGAEHEDPGILEAEVGRPAGEALLPAAAACPVVQLDEARSPLTSWSSTTCVSPSSQRPIMASRPSSKKGPTTNMTPAQDRASGGDGVAIGKVGSRLHEDRRVPAGALSKTRAEAVKAGAAE